MSVQAIVENLTWLEQPALQLAGIVITSTGAWAIGRFAQWIGLKNSQQLTGALDDALSKSVTYGLQQVTGLIQQKGWDQADVKSQALDHAFGYMKSHFAGTIAASVTKDQPNVDQTVKEALDRAFPAAVAVAAASPATPPATAPNPPENRDLPVAPQGAAPVGG